MAVAITSQQLIDASVDATSLADFIYQPAGVMVTRRLAPPVNTLQYYIDYMDRLAVGKFINVKNDALLSLWYGTQVEYDAVVTKDPSVVYMISE